MGNVANFSVVRDAWTHEALSNGIDFDVPSTIDLDKRSVLSFMLNVYVEGDMSINLRINGTKVWNWTFENYKRWGLYQEVVAKGVVRPGTNTISFDADLTSGGSFDFGSVEFSDIVVWWRADI